MRSEANGRPGTTYRHFDQNRKLARGRPLGRSHAPDSPRTQQAPPYDEDLRYHARCTRIRKQGTRKSAMPLPPGGGRPLPALPRTHALDAQARPASPPPHRTDRAGGLGLVRRTHDTGLGGQIGGQVESAAVGRGWCRSCVVTRARTDEDRAVAWARVWLVHRCALWPRARGGLRPCRLSPPPCARGYELRQKRAEVLTEPSRSW
jgi:hypothetical protein